MRIDRPTLFMGPGIKFVGERLLFKRLIGGTLRLIGVNLRQTRLEVTGTGRDLGFILSARVGPFLLLERLVSGKGTIL